MSEKTKVHTQYKLADGTRVPGVTTVLGILAKPALIHWAYECGLRGEDYRKVRDSAADIGTLAHYLVMCHLKGETPDTSEYSAQTIDQAETCLLKYWDWEKENQVKPVLIETPLVSEKQHFGGTVDCVARLGNELVLVDYKTGKGIYDEMTIQLAAYWQLVEEAGYHIQTARILRIGRNENEGFEQRVLGDLTKHWQLFEHALAIYNLRKGIKE